jgi:transcriptional regulator with XRE-family HTH domain
MKIETTGALGAAIRARRTDLDLTQQQLADRAGIAVHSVHTIERGNGNPTFRALLSCLAALGLELDLGVRAVDNGPDLLSSVISGTLDAGR